MTFSEVWWTYWTDIQECFQANLNFTSASCRKQAHFSSITNMPVGEESVGKIID